MKIDKVKDIDQLFEVVDGCDGGVTLVTTEGDRLNIKSKLTQYVALSYIFTAGSCLWGIGLLGGKPEGEGQIKTHIVSHRKQFRQLVTV